LKEWILVGHKNDWKPNVYGQVKSWLTGLEPRAVTRDLDWELMSRLKVPKEKLYVWFDVSIDISRLQKNGRYEGKNGNRTGKIKTRSWFIL
jgi:methionyl-tRNA synthetase